jgi:hypothetical protein
LRVFSFLTVSILTVGNSKPEHGIKGVNHLYPRLTELRPLSQLLPRVDVRILRPLERLLQLVQLVRRERGAGPEGSFLKESSRLRGKLAPTHCIA